MKNIKVVKKNNSVVDFDPKKIETAIQLSGDRVLKVFSQEELNKFVTDVADRIEKDNIEAVTVGQLHSYVEMELQDSYPSVADSYKSYRNYKTSFVKTLQKVFERYKEINYAVDRENANFEGTLISTKGSLIKGEILKEIYQSLCMRKDVQSACEEGLIYVHDLRDLALNSINCCLFDVANVLKGGFTLGNMHYSEPTRIDSALDVFGDIILASTSQQYGGWTAPEMDSIFAPYLEKSHNMYKALYKTRYDEILNVINAKTNEDIKEMVQKHAWDDTMFCLRQGLQGLEVKLSSVMSAKGDVPFCTWTFGLEQSVYGRAITQEILATRRKGHNGVPVVFPKLVFLYDENLHGTNQSQEDLFDSAILTSSKCLYPDYLSLTGDGYVPDMYKKYGRVVSPMGCRAFLSPYFPEGEDKPVFTGRANIGAVALNLPKIKMKSTVEGKDFWELLDYCLELSRQQHLTRFEAFKRTKASTNPLGFCEGGFYGGNLKPDDVCYEVVKTFTASFGVTALNEYCVLTTGKSIAEDNSAAIEVMDYIQKRIDEFKAQDGYLYAIYGVPAESLAGTQLRQFREDYGIIPGVSDREYFTNSFHCHVAEKISPVEKQDKEYELFHKFTGGRIQYTRFHNPDNLEAIKSIVKRGMKLGFYQGVNLEKSWCNSCGHEFLDSKDGICPECGSIEITTINRVCGYLGLYRVNGTTRYNDSKGAEVGDRDSM